MPCSGGGGGGGVSTLAGENFFRDWDLQHCLERVLAIQIRTQLLHLRESVFGDLEKVLRYETQRKRVLDLMRGMKRGRGKRKIELALVPAGHGPPL